MRFVVMFFDSLTPSEVDIELTRAHFNYLEMNADRITMAGGLLPFPGGRFCGSLWVVQAASVEEAHRLVEGDPYCLAGLRPDRRIYLWNVAPTRAK